MGKSPKTKRGKVRKAVLEKYDKISDVRAVARASGATLKETADSLTSIEETLWNVIGGKPDYTGNTRTYHGGAVGYEVRCKKCKLKFWTTGGQTDVSPFCVDCEPGKLFT